MGHKDGIKYALGPADEQAHWQEVYNRLVDQALSEAHGGPPDVSQRETRYVGVPTPRNDAIYKVRGRAEYVGNLLPEGVLHGRFVRSVHARARILRVDVSAARSAPGVVDVLTADDLDPARSLVGTLQHDTPVLAKEEVRYVGEQIVAIAAETVEQAEAACDLVEVDYEPLTPVLTFEDAFAPDAPHVDAAGNSICDYNIGRGDIEAGFAEADVVVEGTFKTEPIDHCFMEAQAGIAFVDDDDVLTLLCCTQYPHYHQEELSRLTGLPMEKVRVIQTITGGGFGGKLDATVECAASLMALRSKRPVKMTLSREEVFVATTKRHKSEIHQKLGATKDGKITACDVRILADGGAYRSYSEIVAGRMMVHVGMPYWVPNLRVHLTTAFTNHAPSGAMRSFGVVKVAFANESLMNELATRLGMSPIEIRRINGFADGSETNTGQLLQDVGLHKTFDAIEPIYEARKQELAKEADQGRKVGLGIASLAYGIGYTGYPNPAVFTMTAAPDGSLTAHVGTPDFGTGSDTVFAQIIAETTGLSLSRIQIRSGDSNTSQDAGPTSASRLTYFCGNAAHFSGQDFKRKFEAAFARKVGSSTDDVELRDDGVRHRNEHIGFDEACGLLGDELAEIEGYGKFDPEAGVNLETFRGNPYPTYTYATHLVEAEIDDELGAVHVRRYWAAHDVGRVVNPPAAEGQVEGGVAMGLGMALWERVAREDGQTLNPNYRDYLLAGTRDIPPKIEAMFVTNEDRTGPFGAKGFAESTLIPAPPALGAAIYDAIGVRPRQLPMDSEYIHALIRAREGGGGS